MSPVKQPGCPPLVLVISGPSGVGKDALLSRMRAAMPAAHFTVTMTTRAKRPRERDGVDYFFVTPAEFERRRQNNELLEWANVYGNFYGVPRNQVDRALKEGKDVVIKTDVQGARTIKHLIPEAVLVFIAAPDMDELASRLRSRKTDSQVDIELRLETASKEAEAMSIFDYVVVNYEGKLAEAIEKIDAIIRAERCRVSRRPAA